MPATLTVNLRPGADSISLASGAASLNTMTAKISGQASAASAVSTLENDSSQFVSSAP